MINIPSSYNRNEEPERGELPVARRAADALVACFLLAQGGDYGIELKRWMRQLEEGDARTLPEALEDVGKEQQRRDPLAANLLRHSSYLAGHGDRLWSHLKEKDREHLVLFWQIYLRTLARSVSLLERERTEHPDIRKQDVQQQVDGISQFLTQKMYGRKPVQEPVPMPGISRVGKLSRAWERMAPQLTTDELKTALRVVVDSAWEEDHPEDIDEERCLRMLAETWEMVSKRMRP